MKFVSQNVKGHLQPMRAFMLKVYRSTTGGVNVLIVSTADVLCQQFFSELCNIITDLSICLRGEGNVVMTAPTVYCSLGTCLERRVGLRCIAF